MLDEQTKKKLREMQVSEIVDVCDIHDREESYTVLPFDERMRLIVDYAYEEKKVATVKRLISRARLRFPDADVCSMIYDKRNVDRSLIQELTTCQFVKNTRDVIIEGCTGTGKTWLTCALGRQACKMQHRTRYIRMPDLLMERDEAATVERSDAKILKKYASYQMLLLDEWLTTKMKPHEQQFIFELIERRYDSTTTVFSTQYAPGEWHTRLGGGVQADAIMDRIVHNAIKVDLGDANIRKLNSKK